MLITSATKFVRKLGCLVLLLSAVVVGFAPRAFGQTGPQASFFISIDGDGSASFPTNLPGTFSVSVSTIDGCINPSCQTCISRDDLPANATWANYASPGHQYVIRGFYSSSAQVQKMTLFHNDTMTDLAPTTPEGDVVVNVTDTNAHSIVIVFGAGSSDESTVEDTCTNTTTTSTVVETTTTSTTLSAGCLGQAQFVITNAGANAAIESSTGQTRPAQAGDIICVGETVTGFVEMKALIEPGNQPDTIANIIAQDQAKAQMERWRILQETQTRIYEIQMEVTTNKARQVEVSTDRLRAYIDGTEFKITHDLAAGRTILDVVSGLVHGQALDPGTGEPIGPAVAVRSGERASSAGQGLESSDVSAAIPVPRELKAGALIALVPGSVLRAAYDVASCVRVEVSADRPVKGVIALAKGGRAKVKFDTSGSQVLCLTKPAKGDRLKFTLRGGKRRARAKVDIVGG